MAHPELQIPNFKNAFRGIDDHRIGRTFPTLLSGPVRNTQVLLHQKDLAFCGIADGVHVNVYMVAGLLVSCWRTGRIVQEPACRDSMSRRPLVCIDACTGRDIAAECDTAGTVHPRFGLGWAQDGVTAHSKPAVLCGNSVLSSAFANC